MRATIALLFVLLPFSAVAAPTLTKQVRSRMAPLKSEARTLYRDSRGQAKRIRQAADSKYGSNLSAHRSRIGQELQAGRLRLNKNIGHQTRRRSQSEKVVAERARRSRAKQTEVTTAEGVVTRKSAKLSFFGRKFGWAITKRGKAKVRSYRKARSRLSALSAELSELQRKSGRSEKLMQRKTERVASLNAQLETTKADQKRVPELAKRAADSDKQAEYGRAKQIETTADKRIRSISDKWAAENIDTHKTAKRQAELAKRAADTAGNAASSASRARSSVASAASKVSRAIDAERADMYDNFLPKNGVGKAVRTFNAVNSNFAISDARSAISRANRAVSSFNSVAQSVSRALSPLKRSDHQAQIGRVNADVAGFEMLDFYFDITGNRSAGWDIVSGMFSTSSLSSARSSLNSVSRKLSSAASRLRSLQSELNGYRTSMLDSARSIADAVHAEIRGSLE